MPTQPKKSKPKAKKKITSQKSTPKRRCSKKAKRSNFKKNILVVLGVLSTIVFVVFGYFIGNHYPSKKETTLHGYTFEKEIYSTKELLNDISKIEVKEAKVIQEKKPYVEPVKVIKVEKKPPQKPLITEPEKKKLMLADFRGKPRVVIIIDDVSTTGQMKRLGITGMKLTPSIFPPSELSMKSHKLATSLEHYIIHLPMESGNKKFNTQYKTLMTNDSVDTIDKRVKEIRKLFPNAKYVNNHTGSVFTANYNAMNTLYTALDKEGFIFIDSRTIGSSKVKKIASEFGDRYISRDIFIDNKHNIPYIHQKLKEAVSVAKRKGYAIAIGHPHKITMDALQQANPILKDVEVVYLDEIFKK